MAITFDAASVSGGGNVASITWSHTCSGDNRILLVGIHEARGVENVSGVTFNGDALTRIDASLTTTGCYLYYLIAPDTGTHDIVVTFTSTQDRGHAVGAVSLNGVDQSSPLGNKTKGILGVAGKSKNLTLTTGTDGSWVIDCAAWRPGSANLATIVADAGQTQRANKGQTHTSDTATLGMSTEPMATAGNATMGWTSNINCQADIILTEIKASAEVTSSFIPKVSFI